MKFLKILPLLLIPPLFGQWEIPSPENREHPGSEIASPLTYPDEAGFQQRGEILIHAMAPGGLDKWRRGYFAGGDPGKYLPGQAMAKLLLDPEDPEATKYLNDERSYKEHYHFAAVNWARFLPIFGEQVLTPGTRQKLAAAAKNYGSYKNHGGTENHKTMWWTSANVLPYYLEGDGGLSHQSREQSLASAKADLYAYIKGLYDAGPGEWDSSTYTMFTMNGLMNIYDFSEDEESRLLAKAGLDLLAASYAQKYTHGIFAGPHQRGFAKEQNQNIADQSGFLWWGDAETTDPGDLRNAFYAMHACTSSWRPNAVLTRIARKQDLPFPVEQRNSKPNYWHGQRQTPVPGSSHESVYLTENLTMGSLWDAHASQHSRFNIITSQGKIFSGGHPRKSDHTGKKTGLGHQDGSGRYLQSAQAGPWYLAMAQWPADESADYTFFSFPESLQPETYKGWYVFKTQEAQIAVRPLMQGEVVSSRIEDKKAVVRGMLKFPAEAQQSGFLVWVGPVSTEELDALQIEFDSENGRVQVNAGFQQLDFQFNPDPNGDAHGSLAAKVAVNGEEVRLADWPIYDGPLLQQTPGVLTVSDGRESFTIDFTGDLPQYR